MATPTTSDAGNARPEAPRAPRLDRRRLLLLTPAAALVGIKLLRRKEDPRPPIVWIGHI